MAKKSTVKLRVFKGQKLSYNQDGSIQNENQIITLPHNRVEWINFLDKMKMNNYLKVDVESANYIEKTKDEEGYFVEKSTPCTKEEVDEIKKEIKKALATPVAKLTPEQKQIKELQEQLEEMKKLLKGNNLEKESEDNVDEDLAEIKVKYEEVVGKKPHHKASREKMLKDIEEAIK